MKNIFKGILALSLLCAPFVVQPDCDDECTVSCGSSDCDYQYGKTYFHAREAGTNLPLRMMGSADKMHLFEKECEFYGVFSIAVGYERSRNSCDLGKVFSFNSSGTTLFAGDQGTNANAFMTINDADSNARSTDFGMSGTHAETLKLTPSISKVLVDFDLFVGLDEFINGVWARISAPVVYARYNLDPCPSVTAEGGQYYLKGFVANTASTVKVPYSNVKDAWGNQGAYGDVLSSKYGKLPCGSQSKTRLGNIDIEVGYDIIRNECARLGIAILAVAPTGNSPDIGTLFDPIAGTFNWQLGGTLGGSWVLWNCNDEQSFTLYGQVNIVHLFRANNERLFGWNNLGNDLSAGSSYILLKQFDSAGAYDNAIERSQNLLARRIKVGNSYMTDFALMLQYRRCAFDLSIGYNFWYRSKDTAEDCGGCVLSGKKITANTYGIKGVNPVGNGSGTANNNFYTKSTSNIALSGTNVATSAAAAGDYLLESDVRECTALAPSAYSNKVFGYLGYNWDNCDYTPYLGIGGMYEWAHQNRAADKWGLYIKGGLSF